MFVLPNYAQNYAGTIESSLAAVGVEFSEMRLETRLKYVWEVEEKGKTGIWFKFLRFLPYIPERNMFFGKLQPPPHPQCLRYKVTKLKKKINRESKVFFQMSIYLGECLWSELPLYRISYPSRSQDFWLRLDLNEQLRFDVHIESLCKKISKRIGILNRIKAYLPRTERILCNNSLIKPLILYFSVTWTSCCSHDNINKIFKLQKCCVRIILDAQQHHGTVDLFNILGWVPYNIESDIKRCLMAYKRIMGTCPA